MINKLEDIDLQKKEPIIQKKEKKRSKLSKKEKAELKQKKKQQKIEEKLKKNEDKKVINYITEKLPFIDVTENDEFEMKDEYLEIFEINAKDISSMNEDEIQMHILAWGNFIRNYGLDHKIVEMTFPVSTSNQISFLEKRKEIIKSDIALQILNEKIFELQKIHENRYNNEFYLLIFAEDLKELHTNKERVLDLQNNYFSVKKLSLEKKIKILFKLNNMNTDF